MMRPLPVRTSIVANSWLVRVSDGASAIVGRVKRPGSQKYSRSAENAGMKASSAPLKGSRTKDIRT